MSLPDLAVVGKPNATIVHLDPSLQVIENTVSLLSVNHQHAWGICRTSVLSASMLGHQNASHHEDESRRGCADNADGI